MLLTSHVENTTSQVSPESSLRHLWTRVHEVILAGGGKSLNTLIYCYLKVGFNLVGYLVFFFTVVLF